MDIGCPACRDAGKYLDADGAERGADVVAQRVYRARGGGAKRQCAARDCGETQAGDAAGDAGSAATVARSDPLIPVRMWMGTNIRRVAHTVEFFFVGLFASSAAVCLDKRMSLTRLRHVPVLVFCAVCSVGDQVHKIFVPGRHFDVVDLGFDAAGYAAAMLLVLLVAALARRATCPIGTHTRR